MRYLSAVDSCFIDRPGGMERVAWDAATAMRDRGHRVSVICGRLDAGVPEGPAEVDGIRVVRFDRPPVPEWHPRRDERAIENAAAATRRWLGGDRFDTVHMHSPFTGAGVMRALGSGPRYVYTMHSPVVLEQRINWSSQGVMGRVKLVLGLGRLRRLERRILEGSQGIQTLSEYTRREIERFHGMGDRVTVIPHWRRGDLKRTRTKAQARAALGWPADPPILFTVRRHAPRYGLDDAIRAIAPQAAAGRCRFYVAGDGPMRPRLEALARSLGADGSIQFTGRVNDEQLALAYEAADLFILPTRALECFGLITLEAFAFGCPVLSTDCCAIPETMRPIAPDFIVPAGDETALRAKVEAFLDGTITPPTPEALDAYLHDHFDQQAVVDRLAALLEGPA